MQNPAQLFLPESEFQVMLKHVQSCIPEEACGLLGGKFYGDSAQVAAVLPVENELHSPVRFRMAPQAQLAGFQWLDARELELVAIFHSHPTGPDHPSLTDLAEFAYPGVVTLIWSPGQTGWQLRGFLMDGGETKYAPVKIAITS